MRQSRVLYLLMLLLGVAGVLALGVPAAFLALYSMLLLPLFSALVLALYPRLVAVRPKLERRHFFKGEQPVLQLSLLNRTPFAYPDVELRLRDSRVAYQAEDPEEGPRLSLPPLRRAERRYTLRFPYRGIYEVGLHSARVTDLLGLLRLRFRAHNTLKVTVYPQIIDGFELPQSTRQAGEGDQGFDRFTDQTADVSDHRRHNPSDDYRRIHWKLSAKRGEFIVKDYRAPGLTRTLVVLDTRETDLGRRVRPVLEDAMAGLAASCLDCCLRRHRAARLSYGPQARESFDLSAPEDLTPALGLLAAVRFDRPADALSLCLQQALQAREAFADMAVVAARLDEPACDLLKAAFTQGHDVFLYYACLPGAGPDPETFERLDGLAAYGIQVEIVQQPGQASAGRAP